MCATGCAGVPTSLFGELCFPSIAAGVVGCNAPPREASEDEIRWAKRARMLAFSVDVAPGSLPSEGFGKDFAAPAAWGRTAGNCLDCRLKRGGTSAVPFDAGTAAESSTSSAH